MMYDIDKFIKKFYKKTVPCMISIDDFDEFKVDNNIEEWDYPLEEYKHITDISIDCVPVRFKHSRNENEYEYRFCEIPR